MALRQLMLSKKIEQRKEALSELLKQEESLKTRSEELEAALEEAKTDEEIATVDGEISKLDTDQKDFDEKKSALEGEISELEGELAALNSKAPANNQRSAEGAGEKRNGGFQNMINRTKFFGMDTEQRSSFFTREDVSGFVGEIRASLKTRAVVNGLLTIPDVVLELLRDNMEQYSKLAKYVTVKPINGTARQNIMGTSPEGIWMEAFGELNELDLSLNQVEVDGYMVGGFIPVHNTLLDDSDIALGTEIITGLGKAIGKGIDRAIPYGTGVNMPLGFVTRLAQTSKPSDWGDNAPTWTDLHTSNIKKLNISSTTGAAFYASLIEALGIAKPNYSDGQCFWIMNRKTHIDIMTKALAFDAAAALVAGVKNQMPIIGGDIVELEIVGDYEIIGGFGSVYLLAERADSAITSSEHVRFLKNQTVFKGYARYDGMPVFGEAFVVVSYDNSDAVTTSTFPKDYANTELGVLGVTAAAGTASGDTVLTVTGTEESGTTLKYKIGDLTVKTGQTVTGYTELTSGTTQITAAAGKMITVVELDGNSKVIKAGKAVSVPQV